MKIKLLIFFPIVFLVGCFSYSNKKHSTSDYYKIKSIDSIHNYYIIRAIKSDSVFNILSKKGKIEKCEDKIFKDKLYIFKLHSIYKDILPIIVKNNLYQVTSWGIDDSLSIKIDSIKNYYTDENIKGLCKKPPAGASVALVPKE